MGVSKKKKEVRRKEDPGERYIAQGKDPERFYDENPAWTFANADQEMWAFSQEHIGDDLWNEIIPKLKGWETQTWKEILIIGKKQNHSIDLNTLNKAARDRLVDLHIEYDSLISLRLSGTHRLYGYHSGRVFNILWYDDDHGDNDTCVCRSHKKNT